MSKLTADEFFKLPNAKRPDRRKILLDAINSNKGLEVYLSGNKETVMTFPKAESAFCKAIESGFTTSFLVLS